MLSKLNRSIDHLIIQKILEIIVVIILIIISMSVWSSFKIGVSASKITTIEDYKMNFIVNHVKNQDVIIAENPYFFSKIYSIFLVVDETVDLKNTSISVNDKNYVLDEFYCQAAKGKWNCTIINDELVSEYKVYNISLNLDKNASDYMYIFGESNNF